MLFQDLGASESWHLSLHSPSLLFGVSKLHSLEGADYGVSISLQVATSQDCFSLMCEALIEILKTASVLVEDVLCRMNSCLCGSSNHDSTRGHADDWKGQLTSKQQIKNKKNE